MGTKILLILASVVTIISVAMFVGNFSNTKSAYYEINPLDLNFLTGEYDMSKRLAYFHTNEVRVPAVSPSTAVLGTQEVRGRSETKRIEISLTKKSMHSMVTIKYMTSMFPRVSGPVHQLESLESGRN